MFAVFLLFLYLAHMVHRPALYSLLTHKWPIHTHVYIVGPTENEWHKSHVIAIRLRRQSLTPALSSSLNLEGEGRQGMREMCVSDGIYAIISFTLRWRTHTVCSFQAFLPCDERFDVWIVCMFLFVCGWGRSWMGFCVCVNSTDMWLVLVWVRCGGSGGRGKVFRCRRRRCA